MTVCVATICDLTIGEQRFGPMIIGASDRMITAGDVQFEIQLQAPKLLGVTNSIVLMLAGDMAIQAELAQGVSADVKERLEADKSWMTVRFVAESYVRRYNEAKRWRAENSILAPLGLTLDTFVGRQREMSSRLVSELASDLRAFE